MARPAMFYGWRVVAVAALSQAVSVGSTFYAYGIFVKPLAAEFGASRLVVVLGITLLILVQGLIAPALGRALDRGSVRAIMASGVLLLAAGFALLSTASALWQIAALFASAIAIGSFLFGPLATSTLVARWFVRRRGRALGFTAVGASAGGFVFPPAVAVLVEGFGWRAAAGMLAAGIVLLVVPIWLVIVNRPEDRGASPDGDPPADPEPLVTAAPPQGAYVTAQALLRSRNFWAITASIGLVWCPVSVLLAHLVAYATDLGISPQRAALLMSGYAATGALGRVLFGTLADRIDKRLAAWIAFSILGVSWANLLGEPAFFTLLVASLAMGVGVGGIMPLWGALTGACFGRSVFGRAMGLMNPFMLPFNLAGAPAAALLYDRTGSYGLAFGVFLGFFAAAALTLAFLRVPDVEPGTAPARLDART